MPNEDFKNAYVETDPATYINADTADIRANFVAMPLNIDAWFSRDFTSGHFTDFIHLIDFYLDIVDGTSNSICGCSFGTTSNDLENQTDAFQVYMLAKIGVGQQFIYIRDISDGDTDGYTISIDKPYYLKLIRNGTAWSIEIYDEAARTTLLDTILVTGTSTAFQYVLAAQSLNAGAGGSRSITGWMENLDLQEVVGGWTRTVGRVSTPKAVGRIDKDNIAKVGRVA